MQKPYDRRAKHTESLKERFESPAKKGLLASCQERGLGDRLRSKEDQLTVREERE